MSFQNALSGINAATTDLDVISNNIANVNTNGFKKGRVEFADLVTASPFSQGSAGAGSGVAVASISQQFEQGNITNSNNPLDLAITGQGFFVLSDSGAQVFSRAGNFSVDNAGFVINPAGQRLQVYPPNALGGFNTGSINDLQLQVGNNAPTPTSAINMVANLPATDAPPVVAPFTPLDGNSYNHSSSLTIFDSLGVEHVATMYFVKTAVANQWNEYNYMDGVAVGGAQPVQFTSTGSLAVPLNGQIALPAWLPPNGSAALPVTINLFGTTQYSTSFGVNALRQDGNTTGTLIGIDVNSLGIVSANFSNGKQNALGQVALTSFTNTQGMKKVGDNAWIQTADSGQPLFGQAGAASFGQIQSNALESSNVNQTEELVHMIAAQRNFQANAQLITTQDQITQTILQIR